MRSIRALKAIPSYGTSGAFEWKWWMRRRELIKELENCLSAENNSFLETFLKQLDALDDEMGSDDDEP